MTNDKTDIELAVRVFWFVIPSSFVLRLPRRSLAKAGASSFFIVLAPEYERNHKAIGARSRAERCPGAASH